MKREEFVEKFLEEFLDGKDDDYREDFLSRPLDRQYGTIQTWRRRRMAKIAKEDVSAIDIIDTVKCAAAQINNLQAISPKEMEKLNKAIDTFKENLDNFENIVRQRRLRELQQMREQLEKEISQLEGNA